MVEFAFSCVIMDEKLFYTFLSKTKLTYNLPAEMTHSFRIVFIITQFAGLIQFQSKID